MTTKKAKSISVMLDGEIVVALQQMQQGIITKMNKAGVHGLAAVPSLGYIARALVRSRLGIKGHEGDDAYTE